MIEPALPTAERVTAQKATLGPAAMVWLLAALFSLQPLATDFYLASLPGLGQSLQASPVAVQWTLSAYVCGFGVLQWLLGPVADRYGRFPVLLGGVGLYALACIAAMLAPTIGSLIAARFFQGLGSCAAIVATRAMVRDLYDPAAGASLMASSGFRMGLVPLFAPTIGGAVELALGWRGAFAVMTAFSVAVAWVVVKRLRESMRPEQAQALAPSAVAKGYAVIVRHPAFQAYTAVATLSYASLFAFISASAPLLIKTMNVNPALFGVWFSVPVIGYLIGSAWCKRKVQSLGLQKALRRGVAFSLASGVLVLGLSLAGVHQPWALTLPMFVFLIGHGINQPCAQIGAIAAFPERAGAATALLGTIIMVVSALVGWAIGASFDQTTRPLAITQAAAALALFLVVQIAVRRFGAVESVRA